MFAAPPALHVANLTGLVWLRKECRACTKRAADLFGFDVETAGFYRGLCDSAVEALCVELDLSLFLPRFDSQTLPQALAQGESGHRGRGRSELGVRNLANLQALREVCERSIGDAVWTYRINQETVDAYSALEHGQVIALSRALSVSAFVPRYGAAEATRILDKPAGARAVFAAAYETEIAASSDAAQRSHFLTH